MFTKTILEISISIGTEKASVHYSNTRYTGDELNKLKVLAFLLYTVRMIWNSGQDYKPLRSQIRHILDNPPRKGEDCAWPVTFASRYTETYTMELVDAIEKPIITFSGKVTKNTDGSFFIYTKLGSLFQYNLGARHTPTSTLIFWQDLMNTLSEEANEKVFTGLRIILDYFDSIQNEKWSTKTMNEAIGIVNKIKIL